MAKVTRNPAKTVMVERLVEVPETVPETITLTLSKHEAEVLMRLLYSGVGGTSKARDILSGATDSLAYLLKKAGVRPSSKCYVTTVLMILDGERGDDW